MTLHHGILFVAAFVLQPLFPVLAQSAGDQAEVDTLTISLCNNQEQIVARQSGEYRIAYYMGETELNMKTMGGFLSLNSASAPLFRKFKMQRWLGVVAMIGGVGLIVADAKISRPAFPVYTLAGIATSIGGVVVFFRANDKFRLAIHAYNKDICHIR
jgi:hypothetical protein